MESPSKWVSIENILQDWPQGTPIFGVGKEETEKEQWAESMMS